MLDLICQLLIEKLELSTSEVNAAREARLAEQATADARYAVSSALIHPEGSTTPINEAYSRAQDRVANLRSQLEKIGPEVLALLLAFDIAVQRRDEADKHVALKWKFQSEESGLRPEVRDWWLRLSRHGVHPHYLKQHSEPTIAIIADLVAWKAKDPTFKDPDNPWRLLLGIYANRLVEVPGKPGKAKRSVSGTPERNPHPGGDKYYMFNEMVSPHWAVPTTTGASTTETPPPQPTPSVVSNSETDDAKSADALSEATDVAAAPAAIRRAIGEDEYPTPAHIAPDDIETLRRVAELWTDRISALSEMKWALEAAERKVGKDDEAAIINEIANMHPGSFETTPRYFIEAARSGGIRAGWAAHRQATIQRAMTVILDEDWRSWREANGL